MCVLKRRELGNQTEQERALPAYRHCARHSVSTFSVNPHAHRRHCYHPHSTEKDKAWNHSHATPWPRSSVTLSSSCMNSSLHPKAAQRSQSRRHLGWGHGEKSGDIREINSRGPGWVKLGVSPFCSGLRRLLWNPKLPTFQGPPALTQ